MSKSPTPRALAEALVETVRGYGLETAIRASLEAVYTRWLGVLQPEPTEVRVLPRLDPRSIEMLDSRLRHVPASAAVNDSYLRDVFEALLELRASRLGRAAGESASGTDVARAMAVLAGEGRRLLDPACGVGNSLLAAAATPRDAIVGYEINSETASITRMRFNMAGINAEIRADDWLLSWNYGLGVWDSVCLEPPFSMRLTEEQREGNRALADAAGNQGDLVWLQRVVNSLAPDGYGVVLLPLSSVTSAKAQSLRNILVAEGTVDAIISLPSGAALGTSVETCIWVLRGPGKQSPDGSVVIGRVSRLDSGESDDLQEVVSAILRWRRTGALGSIQPWRVSAVGRSQLTGGRSLAPQHNLPEVPLETEDRPQAPARHLSELRLENFKGVGTSQSAYLRPLTLIYGKNSAGKSSLIQALILLRQSLPTTTLAVSGPLVDLGSFHGLVHRHELDREVSIGVSFGSSPAHSADGYLPTPALLRNVEVSFAIDPRGAASSRSVVITLDGATATFRREEGGDRYEIETQEVVRLVDVTAHPDFWYPRGRVKSFRPENGRRVARLLDQKNLSTVSILATSLLPHNQIATDLRSDGPTRQELEASYIRRAMEAVGVVSGEVTSLLSKLAYLGPLREAPKRYAARGAPQDATLDMAYFLLDNTSEREQVSTWMARLGLNYQLDVVSLAAVPEAHVFGELVAIALKDARSGAVLSPADVGFGVSQVLPILVELSARTESVVLIEQPEIHLHPAMQAELADVLLESVDDSGRRNQVIAETHSEHIMLRVQRRIREGQIAPDDVSVLYVDQDQHGTATIQRLRLREDGEFADSWPHGFFADRFDEIFSDLL